MRISYIKAIGGKTDNELINWANDTVGGKHPSIQNFKDPSLADSKFLINLLAAIEPRAVNWDLVLEGGNDDEKMTNAKYAISIARKLGCTIFCVWEDLVNVNSKQILLFVATAMGAQMELSK